MEIDEFHTITFILVPITYIGRTERQLDTSMLEHILVLVQKQLKECSSENCVSQRNQNQHSSSIAKHLLTSGHMVYKMT